MMTRFVQMGCDEFTWQSTIHLKLYSEPQERLICRMKAHPQILPYSPSAKETVLLEKERQCGQYKSCEQWLNY